MPRDFKDLLRPEGIDPKDVLVLRHAPTKYPKLRAALLSLAKARTDVFNAYQTTQWPAVEKAMGRAEYVASFIGREPGKAVFVGVYHNLGGTERSTADLREIPAFKELEKIDPGSDASFTRATCILYELELMNVLTGLIGKLVVDWPRMERNWYRWADRNSFVID